MTTPWRRSDAVRALVLILLGAAVWFIGWWQVSDRPAMDQQVAPMNLAVVGLLVIGVGQSSWFLAGRRAVGVRRRALLGSDATGAPVASSTRTASELYVGGERFFHRTDCGMGVDRAWTPVPRTVHERAGRAPCGVCKP